MFKSMLSLWQQIPVASTPPVQSITWHVSLGSDSLHLCFCWRAATQTEKLSKEKYDGILEYI